MNTGDAAVQASWASARERGTLFMMRLMVWGLSLPRRLVAPFVYLATAYFFLFGARARAASRDYLARVARAAPEAGLRPGSWLVYRHFLAFSQSILD
jgi:predicted LPLAT superfamily acyltransferase